MNKKVIIGVLVVLMLVLGGAAIFIAVNLSSQQNITPEGVSALSFTNYSCSGACDSGRECNQYGDPPAGKMWACWLNGSSYKCAYSDINEGGNACWGCPGNTHACGCDESACESACLAKISSGGSATHTMLCGSCQQKFTCECSKGSSKIACGDTGCVSDSDCSGYNNNVPGSITCDEVTGNNPAQQRCVIICPSGTTKVGDCSCVTATPTITPSHTPTITPTKVVTTLPPTALITDEVDRVLIGVALIFFGLIIYKNNLYYSTFFFFKNTFRDVFVVNPKKKNKESFEKSVEKEVRSK